MAAIIIIEASGLGATLPLILVPGFIAAGIGSLIFIGMTHWTGLDTSAYTLAPLQLAGFGTPTVGEIAWTILLGVVASYLMTLALEGRLGQANDTSGSPQERSTAGPAGATGD
jgi:hypothetical protein